MKKQHIIIFIILNLFITTFVQADNWQEKSAEKKLAIRYFGLVKHYMDEKHKLYGKTVVKYYLYYAEEGGSFMPISINENEVSYEEAVKRSMYAKIFFVNNKPVEIQDFFDQELIWNTFLDDKQRQIFNYKNDDSIIRIRQFQGDKSLDVFYCDSVCHENHLTKIEDAYLYIDGPDMGNNPLKKKPPSSPIIKDIQWVNEFLGVKAGESYRDKDAMKLYEQYSPIKDKYLQDIKKDQKATTIKYFIDGRHDEIDTYFKSAIDANKLGKKVSYEEALNKGIYSKVAFMDDKPIFQEAFNKDKDIMKRYFDEKGRVVFRIDYDEKEGDSFAIFKFRNNNKWMDLVYCYDEQCIINDYLNFDALEYKGNSKHIPSGLNIVD